MATALAKLDEVKRAEQWATTALAIAPDDYLTLYNIACYYSVGGPIDQAFAVLGGCCRSAIPTCGTGSCANSDFDPLHDDPRWNR